jgi:glycosyltransferase involved in cell wall biosynthesis
MKTNRILAIIPGKATDPGACEIYRITQPLYFLGQQPGWKTGWTWWSDMLLRYHKDKKDFMRFLTEYDLFVLPRTSLPHDTDETAHVIEGMGSFFKILRRMGKHVIYETDDDYTNEYREVTGGNAINLAKWTDAVTVTTPYLARTMNSRTKLPTYIVPNCVDASLWRDSEEPVRSEASQGRIIIGLTGSPTHYKDWQVLAPIMKQFMERNPNVTLVLMGFHPDYLDDVPNTVRIPGLTYPKYSSIIRGCDIILCPVDPTDGFNMGKSPIKAVEAQAAMRTLDNGQQAGAAVIATNNPVYSLAIKNDKTGLLVEHTPEAWNDALQLLVERRVLRQDLQVRGFNAVYKQYDASREWKQWASVYRKVLSKPLNSVHTLSA